MAFEPLKTDRLRAPDHTNYLITSKNKGHITVQLFDPWSKMKVELFDSLVTDDLYGNCIDSFVEEELLKSAYPEFTYLSRESHASVQGGKHPVYPDIYSELYFSLVCFNEGHSRQTVLDYLSLDSNAVHKWFNYKLRLMRGARELFYGS
jgi:hypothetical protein